MILSHSIQRADDDDAKYSRKWRDGKQDKRTTDQENSADRNPLVSLDPLFYATPLRLKTQSNPTASAVNASELARAIPAWPMSGMSA